MGDVVAYQKRCGGSSKKKCKGVRELGSFGGSSEEYVVAYNWTT